MKRLLLLAAGCAAAATLVPNALAAYQPRLQVDLVRESPAVGGPVTFRVSQPAGHDATAKMVIYTPQGFRPTLGQSPGFQVGTVVAQARAAQLGGALVPLQGRIVADDAAKYPRTRALRAGTSRSGFSGWRHPASSSRSRSTSTR
jgi:hypothetical protein